MISGGNNWFEGSLSAESEEEETERIKLKKMENVIYQTTPTEVGKLLNLNPKQHTHLPQMNNCR